MNRLRILILAPDANPEGVSIPYVTYSHAAALAQLHDISLVVRPTVEDAVRRAKAPFRSIEVVRMPRLERIYAWCFRRIFKSNFASQAVTAFGYPFALAFEWYAWRQLRQRILAGEFDVVLRLIPMTAVLPSPFAFFLRKGPIPFVIGPINGGLPFVKGFSQASGQKEWISNLRGLYRFLPFARSTYRDATAIIAASSQTYAEFAAYSDKLFFVPEPGIARNLCNEDSRSPAPGAKFELIFVGGLIPCKACDLGLRAAAPLLRSELAHFTILGDGPERNRLEQLVKSLGIEKAVSFGGWVRHAEVLSSLRSADVWYFRRCATSVQAWSSRRSRVAPYRWSPTSAVPATSFNPKVGYKVPLTNEGDFVSRMEKILAELDDNRDHLRALTQAGHGLCAGIPNMGGEGRGHYSDSSVGGKARPEAHFPPPKVFAVVLILLA